MQSHTTTTKPKTTMSFLNNLLSNFSRSSAAPAPVAVSTVVDPENSAEVRFGFNVVGRCGLDQTQTYASFAAQRAAAAGISLQDNYTAQYIVNGTTFVVDPSLTFAELNVKYAVTPTTPVQVAIPDPERPAGRLGSLA